ncbi:MAG: tetratricopeptide repeat protein [Planctomycetales bacterium]|nr:tetratricopeptide repeat protein [Planctomycetales bacterium]
MSPVNTDRAFLADFGLAKLVSTGSKLTRTGQALGTPAYMSPEQARGQVSSLAPAADVWSLACVVHEMLAGRPPFEGETSAAVIGRVLLKEPPTLRRLRPDVPPGLQRVLRAALDKQPCRRPRDGASLRDDLDRVLRGLRPLARPRHRLWAVRVLAAALATAAAWGALLARRPGPGAAPPDGESGADPRTRTLAAARRLRATAPEVAAGMLERLLEQEPSDREARLERSGCLREAGRWRLALGEYDRILREDPSDAAARAGRGLTAWLARDSGLPGIPDPSPDLRSAARGPPGPLATLAGAILAYETGDLAGGERLAADAGDGWEACFVRGLLRHHRGRGSPAEQEHAIREFDAALQRGPPFPWALVERGHAKDTLGDPAGCVADCDAALRIWPGFSHAWIQRGVARDHLRDFRGAVEDFTEAMRADPGDARGIYNRAVTRRAMGDLTGAVEDFTAALRIQPDYAQALNNRGALRGMLGDPAGALADLDAALRVLPGDPEILANRGAARAQAGDLEGGLADLTESLRRRPGNADALANRGTARAHLGDMPGGLTDFDAALAIRPGDAPILTSRGQLRLDLGDPDGGLADLRRAIEIAPTRPDAYGTLGLVLKAAGDFAGAAVALREFLRLAPLDSRAGECRAALAECEAALGGTRGGGR